VIMRWVYKIPAASYDGCGDHDSRGRATVRIRPFFRWYDMWIGLYVDQHNPGTYYICLFMFGLKVTIGR